MIWLEPPRPGDSMVGLGFHFKKHVSLLYMPDPIPTKPGRGAKASPVSISPWCLISATNDATNPCLAAWLFPFESSEGYPSVLCKMVREYGILLSIYRDRSSVLKPNGSSWILEEQLRGKQDSTQVGWALQEFGVEPIYALSP